MDVTEATKRWGLKRLQEDETYTRHGNYSFTDPEKVTVKFEEADSWTCGEGTCWDENPSQYVISYMGDNGRNQAVIYVEVGDLDLLEELLAFK